MRELLRESIFLFNSRKRFSVLMIALSFLNLNNFIIMSKKMYRIKIEIKIFDRRKIKSMLFIIEGDRELRKELIDELIFDARSAI